MLSVAHNLTAMNSMRMLGINTRSQASKTEKLSSGYKINRAADDAAGLAISEKMRWMIRGLHQGTENTKDGISFVQIGDGAMGEIHDMINRMEELAVKGSNGTLTDTDRSYIDSEIQQLKDQINQIHKNTVFNEIPIFDNSSAISIAGVPNDLSLFNSTYDLTTGKYTYGGFIFNGERVSWDTIDPNMVDTATNKFNGGTYNYTDSKGHTFTIDTQKGDSVPQFSRNFNISASGSSINVDGEGISINNLYDESGNKLTSDNYHPGAWTLDYKGAEITFYFDDSIESIEDIADTINRTMGKNNLVHYELTEEYSDSNPTKAVDVTSVSNITVSNNLAAALSLDPSMKLTLKADSTGISLVDKTNAPISGSAKTWADLGISSWNSGSDISESKTYKYTYQENGKDVLTIDFKLDDVTSLDSVIDGLDGMTVDSNGITTKYSTSAANNTKHLKMTTSIKNTVDLAQEYQLGRDFSTKSGTLANETIDYDNSTHKATLSYKDASSNDVIKFEGDTSSAETALANKLNKYLDKVATDRIAAAVNGEEYTIPVLDVVVGSGNVTDDGYFAGVITLDSSWDKTNDPGSNGTKHPSAFIDFGSLSTTDSLKKLIGTGFDSTCKTCNNHYSIKFTDSISSPSTSASGYNYKLSKNSPSSGNHTLEIDINSLISKGLTGADVPNAIVEISKGNFDFHFTQYASDGSKLYIYDNRSQSTSAPEADFWTVPYNADTSVSMSTKLTDKSGDGDYVNLNYTYEITLLADKVDVTEESDNTSGKYVKKSDITGNSSDKGYEIYDPLNTEHSGLNRYNLKATYKNYDNSDATDKAAAVSNIVSNTINKIMNDTSVTLRFTDFTTMKTKGDEKANLCMEPSFDTKSTKFGTDEGLYIVHSGISHDKTFIPRFSMTTASMGLSNAGTKTIEQAQKTIEYTKAANQYVSMRRSTYGALQNRLEHTINNNQNKEENMQAAESIIRDTDMAKDMVTYSNNNILMQAGQAMLAQANQSNQGVLALLG